MNLRKLALASLLVTATASCAGGDQYDELGITCEGKCDGLSSVRALVSDAKKLDLQDLINVGAGFATNELNNALEINDYNGIALQPTELYAPASVAAGDLTLKNLDSLVSGLAARFGESSLTTEVNKLRSQYLMSSGKRAYAESAFRIKAGFNPSWNVGTRGFGRDATATATLGFDAGVDLEARVISVHGSETSGLAQAPLKAIKTARGFVLPTSMDDIKKLQPGESFALSGKGKLGVNLGAGVPILIANPTSWLTYSLVLTAGVRSVFEGQMDVQVVRLNGDEVVLDVGVSTATLNQASIALTDGFGVHGLIEKSVNIGGASVDLGKLLDKAINTRVMSKLSLIKAAAERTQQKMRMSVARMRFHLDGADPVSGRGQALAQALKGDIRLAQALAARGDAGVVAEFDLVRSGASSISYAGIDVLGMSFYRRTAESEGSAVIQTPGGALALMWESLHREGGWFFTSHGFTRIGVAGLRFDAREPGVAKSETNLFLQTQEGDKFMERDKVIDQLDSVIVAVAGKDALAALEANGNQMERLIVQKCPLPMQGEFFDEQCNIDLINSDSQIASLRSSALASFDGATAQLAPETRALVHKVAELRLSSQMIEDPNASAVGPTASMVFDFRLDDTALKTVMTKDKVQLQNAVLSLMEATQLDRTAADATAERTKIRSKSMDTAKAMADEFATYSDQYTRLLSIDGARIDTLGQIGGNAVEVRFSVDSSKRVDYDHAVSQSVAQARAGVVGKMYDALRAKADKMPSSGGSSAAHPEQIASFALLAMAPIASTELRVNFKTDNSSCGLCGNRDRYDAAGFNSLDTYAKGSSAMPIAAGLFDVDALIDAPH
jgi:hypothetical protein